MDFGYSVSARPDSIQNRPWTAELVALQARVGTFTRDLAYAFFALLVYDMLLTMKDEIHLIWPARWTVTKGLFLINRYGAPIMIVLGILTASGYLQGLNDSFCQKWMLTNMGMEQLFLLLVSFVLVFRLHAAWETNRPLLVALISLWLAGVFTTFYAWHHVLYSQRDYIWLVPYFNSCFPEIPGLWRLLVPNACLHFVLLAILVTKAIATPRSKDTAMLMVLLRDGIVFYSITFLLIFGTVLIWAFSEKVYLGLPIYSLWSLNTITSSHFLLSLKYAQNNRRSWIERSPHLPTTAAPFQPRGLLRQSSGKFIEMGRSGDWKGRTFSGDSEASIPSRSHQIPTLASQSRSGGIISHTQASSEVVLVESPTTTEYSRRTIYLRAEAERRTIGSWWWWLLGRGAVENQLIEIDVREAEWFDEFEDRGPGLEESKIGRYDGWL